MPDLQYYSDAQHYYLVMECRADTAQQYKYRMLSGNRIPGLLQCAFREIEGETRLYYEVTQKESLESRAAEGYLSGAEIMKLLRASCAVCRTMEEYLLDPEDILFGSRFVFLDDSSAFFLYYPAECGDVSADRNLSAFLKELSDRADPEDRDIQLRLSRVLEKAERENFILSEEMLEEVPGSFMPGDEIDRGYSGGERDMPDKDPVTAEKHSAAPRMQAEQSSNKNNAGEESFTSPGQNPPSRRRQKKRKRGGGRNYRGTVQFCFGCTIFFTFLGMSFFMLPYVFELPGWIPQAVHAALIGSLLLGAIAAIAGILISQKAYQTEAGAAPKRSEDDQAEAGAASKRSEDDQTEAGAASKRSEDDQTEGWTAEKRKRHDTGAEGKELRSLSREEQEIRGADSGDMSEAAGREMISLNELPVTVGSGKDYSDAVLSSSSVSRIHALFSRDDEGRVCVQDLHSRIGTRVNGAALEGNERMPLNVGDEVEIGHVLMVFRGDRLCYDVRK